MRYCEGLSETGERPLSEGERAAVARARRRLAWRVAGPLALALASPVAAGAIVVGAFALAGGGHATALRTAAGVAFVAGILLGPAASLLWAHDRLREWRRLRRDAQAAVAVEFAGGGRGLTVLPVSGRILAWDGRPADLRARARVGAAAAAPPAAPTYALPSGALPARANAREIASHGLVRRPLSTEERDELRDHARSLRRAPRSLWLLAVWWGLAALRWGARDAARKGEIVLIVALPLGIGVWRFLRARALAARLEADAEEGWAIRATAGATTGEEALPASRAAWTSAGVPAPWRLGLRR